MANCADPDQLASSDLDLHCLHRQGTSPTSRSRVNKSIEFLFIYLSFRSDFQKAGALTKRKRLRIADLESNVNENA